MYICVHPAIVYPSLYSLSCIQFPLTSLPTPQPPPPSSCIHLLGELSQQQRLVERVAGLLPALSEAARHRHYCQHLSLLETVLARLPSMAQGLGKRTFKRHLELFLDTIFYGVVSTGWVVDLVAVGAVRWRIAQSFLGWGTLYIYPSPFLTLLYEYFILCGY